MTISVDPEHLKAFGEARTALESARKELEALRAKEAAYQAAEKRFADTLAQLPKELQEAITGTPTTPQAEPVATTDNESWLLQTIAKLAGDDGYVNTGKIVAEWKKAKKKNAQIIRDVIKTCKAIEIEGEKAGRKARLKV